MRSRGLLVKLFTNSQDFDLLFSELKEGHVILLTDLKLVTFKNHADPSAHAIVLSRSTNFTQIYILGGPEANADVETDIANTLSTYGASIFTVTYFRA